MESHEALRIKFDPKKSKQLRENRKRGIGFEEAKEILLQQYYYEDLRSDDPKQFRVIGEVRGRLYSLIYEVREDVAGEFYHLVTLWPATNEERRLYVEFS